MIQFLISGTTLVWVAILVIIVVYNFALTAFALFRSTLDPYGELPFFGYNLFQTFIVILRYGIIGELYEVKRTQCVSLLCSSILFEGALFSPAVLAPIQGPFPFSGNYHLTCSFLTTENEATL